MDALRLFFVYEDKLPDNVGYSLFDETHFVIMALCFFLISVSAIIYKKTESRILSRAFALIPVFLITVRTVYVLIAKVSLIYEFPLHLCSIAGILCLVFEIKKYSFAGSVLYSLGLPGAALAIVFPNGTMYPPVHFISLESYLFHIAVIIYIIIQLMSGNITPNVKNAYESVIFLIITVPLIYLFNRYFHTDYMFLNAPSPGSPLYRVYLQKGYFAYMVIYAVAALTEIFISNITYQKIKNKGK